MSGRSGVCQTTESSVHENYEEACRWAERLMIKGEESVMMYHPDAIPSSKGRFDALTAAQNHADQDTFDAYLAKEMERLSVTDLAKQFEELHGIAPQPVEQPEVVASKLSALQKALDDIRNKPMYDLAMEEDPIYVQNPQFRLMFLRASEMDPVAAANRLVLYMEKKVEFYGRQTLCRSVHMNDLTPEEMETLRAGSGLILNQRDHSGRVVIIDPFIFGPKRATCMRTHYRVLWYMLMCAAEDEETQRAGNVHIMWMLGSFQGFDFKLDWTFRKDMLGPRAWLPLRLASCAHFCIEKSMVRQLVTRMMIALSPLHLRYHIKVHQGTPDEVITTLTTYGIPASSIPLKANGDFESLHHQAAWIAKRKVKEDAMMRDGLFNKIDLPARNDVLWGKGVPINRHPGNVQFRSMISSMLQEYMAAFKTDKAKMTWSVVWTIKSRGGRFLKKDTDDWWVEVTDKDARQKVGKVFVAQSEAIRKKEEKEFMVNGSLMEGDDILATRSVDGRRLKGRRVAREIDNT